MEILDNKILELMINTQYNMLCINLIRVDNLTDNNVEIDYGNIRYSI